LSAEPVQRRGDKRERTRARLITAAAEVIAARGFAQATLEEIAARAGMTKGAIYSNFEGKAELVMAVCEAKNLTLDPPWVLGGDLAAQMRSVAGALVRVLARAKDEARFISQFHVYALGEPELRRRIAEGYARAFERAAQAAADLEGGRLVMPPRRFAAAVQSLALGFLYQSFLTPEEVTEALVYDGFAALTRGALAEGGRIEPS
jgi:AcrR family transcriptional regulator